MTSRSLWNYYRDEVIQDVNENNEADIYRINNSKTKTSKFFKDNTKMIGSAPDYNALDTEFVVLLKYLSHLWRSLDLSLINCQINLDLSWSEFLK